MNRRSAPVTPRSTSDTDSGSEIKTWKWINPRLCHSATRTYDNRAEEVPVTRASQSDSASVVRVKRRGAHPLKSTAPL